MQKENFLFELGVEELPTASLLPIQDFIHNFIKKNLEDLGFGYDAINAFVSPRRIALLVKQVELSQKSQYVEKRGPAKKAAFDENNEPTKALLGFMKGANITVSDLSTLETDKGEWMVYRYQSEGKSLESLLPELLQNALNKMPIAKAMRWGNETVPFIRPVHWLVMLLGDKVIPATLFGCQSDRVSYGHRVMAKEKIIFDAPLSYEQTLNEHYVIADFDKRKKSIKGQIEKIATEYDLVPVLNEDLLQEVTALVEWPVGLKVDFDSRFLKVPSEALIASMESHQKCFALKDKKGDLVASFITIANLESQSPEVVIHGNQKVMSARLSDAEFFFEQDKKVSLSSHIESLKKVIFHKKLGSIYDKCQRVEKLATTLANDLDLDKAKIKEASNLSRCDLLTNMVQEFPELQGVMGKEYARLEGLDKTISDALFEQYLPRFADDALPFSPLGLALSLADRIDLLVGIFAINEKPTGAKDPFKCRRHALAIIRLIIACKKDFSLDALLKNAASNYDFEIKEHVLTEVKTFILERLVNFYQQISSDVIKAVSDIENDNLGLMDKKIHALAGFKESELFKALISLNKRVSKILAANQIELLAKVDESLLESSDEKNLFNALIDVSEKTQALEKAYDYQGLLEMSLQLAKPLADFFEAVMVNCEDENIRKNRLTLLNQIKKCLSQVANLSELQY